MKGDKESKLRCKFHDDCNERKKELIALIVVAFKIYDMDKDGFISNGELFQVLKMMVGSNLKDSQLQQIVDKVKTNEAFE